MKFVLNEAGLTIPDYIDQAGERKPIGHVSEFWDYYGVAVHEGQHEPGDLIFFSRRGVVPTHVGIVLDKEHYVHSPGRDNAEVEIKAIERKPIVANGPERVIYSTNPIGFKSPSGPNTAPAQSRYQCVI